MRQGQRSASSLTISRSPYSHDECPHPHVYKREGGYEGSVPISKHLKGYTSPHVSDAFGRKGFSQFLDTFCIPPVYPLQYSSDFVVSPVFRHFPNPLNMESVWKQQQRQNPLNTPQVVKKRCWGFPTLPYNYVVQHTIQWDQKMCMHTVCACVACNVRVWFFQQPLSLPLQHNSPPAPAPSRLKTGVPQKHRNECKHIFTFRKNKRASECSCYIFYLISFADSNSFDWQSALTQYCISQLLL